MDRTTTLIKKTIASMEEKREELEKDGKDKYADEIGYSFRPSARMFLEAWEQLLNDIDEENDDEIEQ